MQKSEILDFLEKINSHLCTEFPVFVSEGRRVALKIFGKSALMLAGLQDSVGTVDIDILKVEGQMRQEADLLAIESLKTEFGKSRIYVHGYYLEFVPEAIVFLPQRPAWIPLEKSYSCLTVEYLDPVHVAATKLFSTFSDTPRMRDRQDIRAALDQGLISIEGLAKAADQVFDFHSMDARNDRFPKVHSYLTGELMADYGEVDLVYDPEG